LGEDTFGKLAGSPRSIVALRNVRALRKMAPRSNFGAVANQLCYDASPGRAQRICA
jgi:hypothetical protein